MTRLRSTTALPLILGLIILTGCETPTSTPLDPLAVNGRTGSAPEVGYAGIVHIATASRTAGDYGNAISLYRHAATDASNPEPLVALGDTLLEMGRPMTRSSITTGR